MDEKDFPLYLFLIASDNYGGVHRAEFMDPKQLDEADFVVRILQDGSTEVIKSRYGHGGRVADRKFWDEAYERGKQDCRNEIREANIEVISAIESLVGKIHGR